MSLFIRFFRRMPPLLLVLWLLGMLAMLGALGVDIWAALVLWGHWEQASLQPVFLGMGLVELGLACHWTLMLYVGRSVRALRAPELGPRSAMPWLDTWRGQLISTSVLSALPIATIVAALLIPTTSALFALAAVFGALASIVVVAACVWGIKLQSRLEEAPDT